MTDQDAPETRELVFVYGTLRKGASNHFRMEGAQPAGRAVVRGRLYRIDWYPGLVLDEDGGEVRGELYHVTAEILATLDDFEGEEFERIRTEVRRFPDDESEVGWIWIFRGKGETKELVPRGDWLEMENGSSQSR